VDKELSGKVVVVTGGAAGIGAEIAKRLSEEGAKVARLDVAHNGLGNHYDIPCDVTDPLEVHKAFEAIAKKWGRIDLLVNNAGVARVAPIEKLGRNDWNICMDVNATGSFLCSREVIPYLKKQSGSSIVFISSKNVTSPGKDFGAYSVSKAAQAQLAKILAIELAEYGIRVNSVLPDGIFEDSKLWKEIGADRAKSRGLKVEDLPDFYAKRNLLQTRVYGKDVAEAVLFLASARSSKTTGAMLPVDGGVPAAFPR